MATLLLVAGSLTGQGASLGPQGSGPVSIHTHPLSQAVAEGSGVTFLVAATGTGSLHYQWFHNNAEVGTDASTLVISSVSLGDSGIYEVTVTDDNGSVTSNAAGLGVYVPSGTVDPSFSLAISPDAEILSVAVQPIGNIAVGGAFQKINSVVNNRARFAILTPDADLVTQIGDPGFNTPVNAIAVQPDDKVIVTHSGGFNRIRTNGAFDTSFPESTSQCYEVKIAGEWAYVGGYFGLNNPGIRKINIDSNLEDTSFKANATVANGWRVQAIGIQADGKILIGDHSGDIARLNADGTADNSFTATGATLMLSEFHDFAQTADGRVWIGGTASTLASNPHPFLVPILEDGTVDTSRNHPSPINATVRRILVIGNDLIVGGDFSQVVDGRDYQGLIRVLGPTGGFDPAFGPALTSTGVYDLDRQADGKLIAVGTFQGAHNYIVRMLTEAEATFAITGDPRSVEVGAGQPFTLSVGWQGPSGASYQWFEGETKIQGATGQSYTVEEAEAGQSGDYKVEVTTIEGTLTSGTANVTVNGVSGGQTFAQWAAANNLTGNSALPDADDDMDGIPNFAEFIYGLDPAVTDDPLTARPRPIIVNVGGKNHAAVRLRRHRTRTGFQIEVEAVRQLSSNTLETVMEENTNDLGNEVDEAIYRSVIELEALEGMFFRVRLIDTN